MKGSQALVVQAKAPVRLAVGWVVAHPVATVAWWDCLAGFGAASAMVAVGVAVRAMVVGAMWSAAVVTGPTAETGSVRVAVRVAGGEGEGRFPAHRPRLSRSW